MVTLEMEILWEDCQDVEIFGHVKTLRGGHELTNALLREFLTDKSNWEFVSSEGKSKDNKGGSYLSPVAVNA